MKNYSNWMTNNLGVIEKQKIKELTLPASHDSGMSTITQSTDFSNSCNTQTQKLNFTDQLNAGIRYFDLRPIIGGGLFYAGHYSQPKIKGIEGIIGSRGLLLDDFISQVNEFTNKNKELIIFNISHAYNTDDHSRVEGWEFNSCEWDRLIVKLEGLNNRCNLDISDLSNQYLKNFVGTNASVLLFFEKDKCSLDYNEGMYHSSVLDIRGKYSNKIDVNKMGEIQIDQMKKHTKGSGLFKVSWTLTMQFQQALAATMHPGEAKSIEYYAKEAGSKIDTLFSNIDNDTYPNFITLDYINSDITEKCIKLNLNRV